MPGNRIGEHEGLRNLLPGTSQGNTKAVKSYVAASVQAGPPPTAGPSSQVVDVVAKGVEQVQPIP